MSNKSILEQASAYFKSHHPGLAAESIICFLVLIDLGEPTVGEIARAVGMTEPQAYQHISTLSASGAGLIALVNAGDGRNIITLTGPGQAARAAILSALA
ncbi:MarR family transcriptional regulator [Kordiimonas aestuarii]|uniref:MarR family transcriptional regulator n=1 Tax=Kordiimonas aestuarii TaxID=1005925 RepID=UPI0021D29A76|nr:MarR family transcriptional regulator [Kordiimonas aestuarii]